MKVVYYYDPEKDRDEEEKAVKHTMVGTFGGPVPCGVFTMPDNEELFDLGAALYRDGFHRERTHDFGDGKGEVIAHRHKNPNGGVGGWVARTARVAKTAHLGPKVRVYGRAKVLDNATVMGSTRVHDRAVVEEGASVGSTSEVCGNAVVS